MSAIVNNEYNVHFKTLSAAMSSPTFLLAAHRNKSTINGRYRKYSTVDLHSVPCAEIRHNVAADCVCIFCEHRFAYIATTLSEFQNERIRGDYCSNCLRAGGIMRSNDIGNGNLPEIRLHLAELMGVYNARVMRESATSVVS